MINPPMILFKFFAINCSTRKIAFLRQKDCLASKQNVNDGLFHRQKEKTFKLNYSGSLSVWQRISIMSSMTEKTQLKLKTFHLSS